MRPWFLLNQREQNCVKVLKAMYEKKTGKDPCKNKDLFFFLGDNPGNRLTWSFHGRLPTLRHNKALLWSPVWNRWMTGREKLATLGFPVTDSVARAMGVPSLPVKDTHRAAMIAGNAMNWNSVGIVQLVALCCHKKLY